MTQLLTDLVYFVAVQDNNGGDALMVVITNPVRDKQKLMREQDILKQVMMILILMMKRMIDAGEIALMIMVFIVLV